MPLPAKCKAALPQPFAAKTRTVVGWLGETTAAGAAAGGDDWRRHLWSLTPQPLRDEVER